MKLDDSVIRHHYRCNHSGKFSVHIRSAVIPSFCRHGNCVASFLFTFSTHFFWMTPVCFLICGCASLCITRLCLRINSLLGLTFKSCVAYSRTRVLPSKAIKNHLWRNVKIWETSIVEHSSSAVEFYLLFSSPAPSILSSGRLDLRILCSFVCLKKRSDKSNVFVVRIYPRNFPEVFATKAACINAN